jgi:hypothetical protein
MVGRQARDWVRGGRWRRLKMGHDARRGYGTGSWGVPELGSCATAEEYACLQWAPKPSPV